jgi:hypothetical protein
VQVSGTPEHAGLLGVRLLAMEAGVPVYGVPFTLTKVTIADCVDGETNFGARMTDVEPAAGIVIVKRAVVMTGVGVDPAIGVCTASGWIPTPPEQLQSAAAASAATKMRAR